MKRGQKPGVCIGQRMEKRQAKFGGWLEDDMCKNGFPTAVPEAHVWNGF